MFKSHPSGGVPPALSSCILKEFNFSRCQQGTEREQERWWSTPGGGLPQAEVVGLGHTLSEHLGACPGGGTLKRCVWHGWGPRKPRVVERGTGLAPYSAQSPPTSLEGTAQPRLTVPLLVTDGPVAAFGGCFGAVTPDAQLVSTALAVPGTELQRGGQTQACRLTHLREPSLLGS